MGQQGQSDVEVDVEGNGAGEILNRGNEIIVRLDRRTYSPILRQADLPTTEVPWWSGRRLSYEYR